MDIESRKAGVAWLSVISNTLLIILKLIVGVLTGSVSVISEAIHSGVDLLAALIALFSVKTSSRPADKNHQFGHGKVENISGSIEALLIFMAAVWIIYKAVNKVRFPGHLEDTDLGIAVMLASAIINVLVSRRLFKVGRETDSIALTADAWHLRTDVYTSAGVMVGLAIIRVGGVLWPGVNLNWLDPAVAIGVALLIIKAAYNLTLQSTRDLLDTNLPPGEEKVIHDLICSFRPVVCGYHLLRTRKAGHLRFIEFHIQVDPQMTVEKSHALAEELSQVIKERLPHSTVTTHIEPCSRVCDDKCRAGCLQSDGGNLTPRAEGN